MTERKVLLGIGSNKEDRLSYIRQSLDFFKELDSVCVSACSSIYESVFVNTLGEGLLERPKCLNCVVLLETDLSVYNLFYLIESVQEKMSSYVQKRDEDDYLDREIDIDLLWYEGSLVYSSNLIVPHKKMKERSFVLYPLREVFPSFVHPQTRETIDELIGSLSKEQLGQICVYGEV